MAVCGCLHLAHRRLARRCARMPSRASAKLNGSMPMSSRRMIDSGALLVCSVANTRWPVSDASMPIGVGFLVAHFTDHDDVGIGAQERPHGGGEIEPRLGIHLDLAQALLRDFHRILGGPDLGVRRIEIAQHRVQRSGLAGAGRPADEEQSVGLGRRSPSRVFSVALRQAELVERNGLARGQNTHDDVLDAALRGHRSPRAARCRADRTS